MTASVDAAGHRGFTLIEILVVVGLLSLLAIVLLPQIIGSKMAAKISECRILIKTIEASIEAYESQPKFGDYPPDNFVDRSGKYKVIAKNTLNVGIESLMAFVHRPDSRGKNLLEHEGNFVNTDEDKAARVLGKLGEAALVEFADPWGNPFAYFHHRSYKTGKQTYMMGDLGGDEEADDPEQTVQPWSKNGRFLRAGQFQIFSAGPDGIFNTSDDIGNFETPQS
ncbi:MAG: type II secretion system protein [Planctomycetota bacterium]